MQKLEDKKVKENEEFEIFCYESNEGSVCIEFGETAINFSKKRFLEFADKLTKMRDTVAEKYLRRESANQTIVSYRI